MAVFRAGLTEAGYHDGKNVAKPADLPVQHPTKFKLVINLKTVGYRFLPEEHVSGARAAYERFAFYQPRAGAAATHRIFPIYKKEKGRRLAWPFLGKIRWAYDRPRSATARCTAYRGARPAAACRPWPASGRRGAVADGGQERAREEQQQRADRREWTSRTIARGRSPDRYP